MLDLPTQNYGVRLQSGMIQLKGLQLPEVLQSPLAGCTDLAFRITARSYGMKFAFLEMVSSEALVRQNRKTLDLLKTTLEDKPLGAQLVGCDPDIMGAAAAIVEDLGFDLLDLNLGCPVAKIVSPGGGSKLLMEPEKTKKIFKKVISNIKKIPVTVKMRKGFADPSGDEAVRIARIAEDAGFSAVTVHGRTREQGYSGQADWEAIGKVKRALKIPVIGNGDVVSGQSAQKLMAVSGCDGVMIGRGALGNPWIYQAVETTLAGHAEPPPPTLRQLKDALLQHIRLEIQFDGERLAILKSRRIACWYFKSIPGANEFRNRVNQTQTAQDLLATIENFGQNLS